MAAARVQPVHIVRDWDERLRDWVLQTLGFAAAVVFGTWTILAYNEAKVANTQSIQANALAFAAYCAQLSPSDNPKVSQACSGARLAVENSVVGLAVSLFGAPTAYTQPVTTVTVTSTSTLVSPPVTTGGTTTSARTTSSTSASSSTSTGAVTVFPTAGPGSPILGTGEIAGIVVGVTVGIAAVLGFVIFGLGRRRAPARQEEAPEYPGR